MTENSSTSRRKGQFSPGQSGNPGGRPKGQALIVTQARAQGENAILALVAIMNDATAPHAARVSAANAILDRGYGKAPQRIEHDRKPVEHMTDDELLEAIREAAAGEDETAGDPPIHH